ncbi:hypothetical protein SAMN05421863_10482 [Nitrosomonas communis]|uniref:Uncharacterized protein n=1 Tax=Nitrosomonas communis TaxID=44574 RepID=A0A1I4T7X8_9PROT|nr:hypothetical protein SAMN05421863_10482 [Nitrosomonas communis]
MIFSCIFNIYLYTKMLGPLRGASYTAPGANAMLLFVTGRAPCGLLAPCIASGSPHTPPCPIAVFRLENEKY